MTENGMQAQTSFCRVCFCDCADYQRGGFRCGCDGIAHGRPCTCAHLQGPLRRDVERLALAQARFVATLIVAFRKTRFGRWFRAMPRREEGL